MLDFKIGIKETDFQTITKKDRHAGFFIFTGDNFFHGAGRSVEVRTAYFLK